MIYIGINFLNCNIIPKEHVSTKYKLLILNISLQQRTNKKKVKRGMKDSMTVENKENIVKVLVTHINKLVINIFKIYHS